MRDLAEVRARSTDIVTRPDHPFLILGPDALVASRGRLWAIFIPHDHEYRNPQQLLIRQGLTRLALGPRSRSALLQRPDKPIPVAKSDEQNFQELLDASRLQKSVRLIISGPAFRHSHTDAWRTPMERMHRIIRASQQGWPQTEDRRSIDHDPDAAPLTREVEGQPSRYTVRALLRNAIRESFVHDFVLDNGVPYAKHDLRIHRFIADRDSLEYASDPNKALRSAALAGWAIGY